MTTVICWERTVSFKLIRIENDRQRGCYPKCTVDGTFRPAGILQKQSTSNSTIHVVKKLIVNLEQVFQNALFNQIAKNRL